MVKLLTCGCRGGCVYCALIGCLALTTKKEHKSIALVNDSLKILDRICEEYGVFPLKTKPFIGAVLLQWLAQAQGNLYKYQKAARFKRVRQFINLIRETVRRIQAKICQASMFCLHWRPPQKRWNSHRTNPTTLSLT